MAVAIRILTVDDHPLMRAGVASFLATEPGLQVVAEAANGEEAFEKYRELRPDLVLMDLSMPVMDGLEATQAILEEFPDARIIVLTTYAGDEDVHRALDAGAVGYVLKDMLVADILKVIRSVIAGRRGIPPAVAATLAQHTPRIALTAARDGSDLTDRDGTHQRGDRAADRTDRGNGQGSRQEHPAQAQRAGPHRSGHERGSARIHSPLVTPPLPS